MDKIIFAGPVGAGKTTAIGAISEIPPVGTDVNCTDDSVKLKEKTTVAMDYSYITLDDGTRIHLYGTPGQDRFDFMWKILSKDGIGLVLLINRDHPTPLKQLDYYLNAFSEFIQETGVVVGLTKSDINDKYDINQFQEFLYEREQVYPIFDVDARSADDIKILVHALLAVLNH
jgi:signal recognition particle receptor subunit beta